MCDVEEDIPSPTAVSEEIPTPVVEEETPSPAVEEGTLLSVPTAAASDTKDTHCTLSYAAAGAKTLLLCGIGLVKVYKRLIKRCIVLFSKDGLRTPWSLVKCAG